jgi:hypothetical protein
VGNGQILQASQKNIHLILLLITVVLVGCSGNSETNQGCEPNCPLPTGTVSLTINPTGSVTVSGDVTLIVSSTGSVSKVQFLKNGSAVGTVDTEAPFTTTLSLSEADNGKIIFRAEGLSSTNNILASDETEVIVAIETPTPTLENKVKDIRTTAAVSSIKLEWGFDGSEADINGFQLFRSVAGGAFTAFKDESPNSRVFTDTGLDATKSYEYGIALILKDGTIGTRVEQAGSGLQPLPPGQAPGTVDLIVNPVGTIISASDLTLSATATGATTKVRFLKNGVAVGAVGTSSPFTTTIALTDKDNGVITFKAEGLSVNDTVLSSDEVQVLVDIQPKPVPVNWTKLGGVAGIGESVDIASDNNNTMLALRDNDSNIIVKRWTGSVWAQVGSIINNYDNGTAYGTSLVLDESSNPVISWTEAEFADTANSVYVKRFDGTSWSLIGDGSLNVDISQTASRASLTLDSNSYPVVAWNEYNSSSQTSKIYVKRFDGSKWQLVGDAAVENRDGIDFESFVLDQYDNPIIAWSMSDPSVSIFVSHFDGTSWKLLSDKPLDVNPGENAFSSSLTLDNTGNPIVAWSEADGEKSEKSSSVYVKRFDGSDWKLLGNGSPKETFSATSPSLTVDRNGNPILAWEEDDGTYDSYIYVKQWTGSSWNFIGENPISKPLFRSYKPSLSLSNSHIFVAWQNAISSASNIYVKEY